MSEEDVVVEEVESEEEIRQPEVDAAEEGEQTEKTEEVVEENADEEKKQQRQNRVQRRIDKLTREKYELKGRLDALEKVYTRQPEAQNQNVKPIKAAYESDEDYIEAVTDWKVEQKVGDIQANFKKQDATTKIEKTWQDSMARAKEVHSDYEDVLSDADDIRISKAAENAIMSSPMGAEIAYYIAKHPEVNDTLNGEPVAVAMKIGRIEAKIEAMKTQPTKSKAPVSSAPEPVKSVGSRGTNTKDPEKMTMEEFVSYENNRIKKKRGG